MQMFQAGRAAISVYIGDETAAPHLLDAALSGWNQPKAVQKETGPITVMFANMIRPSGAPDDGGAEQLSQIHSRIVGEALSGHSGMEVKRTPDGIMATFSKTSDAISAAIEMQNKTALSNQGQAALSLQMRIGINAGQPNTAETDLFGSVVRHSAQIVERASADQIIVSEAVKEFCNGANFNFLDYGTIEMPGAERAAKIFEVLWRDGNTANGIAPVPSVR
jgi:adenylate cyclase